MRAPGGAAEQVHGAGVLRAGLEHERAAAAAAGLQIDDKPYPVGQGMLAVEGPGAQQAGFLAVADHQHHVPLGRPAGLDRPHDLQGRGDAGRVVGGAGGAGHAVVVGHQGQGRQGAVLARQQADDVFHRRAEHIGPAVDVLGLVALRPLQLGRQAKGGHPFQEVVAHCGVGGRAGGVGDGGHGADVGHGSAGRKGLGRGAGRLRVRASRLGVEQRERRRHAGEKDGQSGHAALSPKSLRSMHTSSRRPRNVSFSGKGLSLCA